MQNGNKHQFSDRGDTTEALIAELCSNAFFADYCFQNPLKNMGKELCDVLVVLGSTALIWQIKGRTLRQNGTFSSGEVVRAVKQARGAKRRLLDLNTPLVLKNVKGEEKTIDPTAIKDVFIIAAIEGGTEKVAAFYDYDAIRGNVHIFYDNFTRFATKHLDTVPDFVEYLHKKELFLADKDFTVIGGEEDLLAHYLQNARSFDEIATEPATIHFDNPGLANSLERHPDFQRKLKADGWSKGWDMLIEKKRAALTLAGETEDKIARDKFLTRMMSHTRLERRLLSRLFFDAAVAAHELSPQKGNLYRRLVPTEHATYVFMFMGNEATPIQQRQKALEIHVLAARQAINDSSVVIGIGVTQHMITSNNVGYEWVLVDMDNKTLAVSAESIMQMRKRLGIWMNPKVAMTSTDEYPKEN